MGILRKKFTDLRFYRQTFLINNVFNKVNIYYFAKFLDCFQKDLCGSRDILGKYINRKEKGSYQPLFRNSVESWQKSEYPLCKIIVSQNNLPVTLITLSTSCFAF